MRTRKISGTAHDSNYLPGGSILPDGFNGNSAGFHVEVNRSGTICMLNYNIICFSTT
ncbi:MAG: hypothetical protein WBP33_02550 [Saprospiraceae bacterium]|nr:hypothetical protein [Saprospiraceae bacterium]